MNYELLKIQKDGAKLIGRKLAKTREILQLSVSEVSNALKIPHYQIRDVERGANNNAVITLLLVDYYYDKKGDYFVINEILSSIRYYWYATRRVDET